SGGRQDHRQDRTRRTQTGAPIPTSNTARHLCSATLNSHSMSGSVKHQVKPMCQRSVGVGHVAEPVAEPVAWLRLILDRSASDDPCHTLDVLHHIVALEPALVVPGSGASQAPRRGPLGGISTRTTHRLHTACKPRLL